MSFTFNDLKHLIERKLHMTTDTVNPEVKDAEFTETPAETTPVDEQPEDASTKLNNIRLKLADLLKDAGVTNYILATEGFDGRGVHVFVPEQWNGQSLINLLAMGQHNIIAELNRKASEAEKQTAEASETPAPEAPAEEAQA